MTCAACRSPLSMTDNPLVYRCEACGYECSFVVYEVTESYTKADGKPGPVGTYGPSKTTFPIGKTELT